MLKKARQAEQFYRENGRPAPLNSSDVDELHYFGAKTHIVKEGENAATILTHSPALGVDSWQLSSQTPEDLRSRSRILSTGNYQPVAGPSRPQNERMDPTVGWNGLLYDVPGHHRYAMTRELGTSSFKLARGLSNAPQQNMWNMRDALGQHSFGGSRHQANAEASEEMMLDDRWASYMNYGFMGDKSAYPPSKSG